MTDEQPARRTASFKIHGMDCAEEVAVLNREVGPLVGGGQLRFDVLNGRMTATLPGGVSEADVTAAVARTGLRAEPWRDDRPGDNGPPGAARVRSLTTAASGTLIGLGMVIQAVSSGDWIAAFGPDADTSPAPRAFTAAYLLAIVAGGWFIVPKAWYALRRLRPDMNLLMVVAVAGAVAIGEWLEAATVTFLFAVSIALEGWSVGRARRAVAALMELTPAMVRVVDAGGDRLVPPGGVAVGTTFVVRPGDRVALDGEVTDGRSEVNQAPITGESVPVAKQPGDPVYAGTVNGDGSLTVRSAKPASDTTLARIIRMVGDAQSRRAPAEQWVERFARVYTPAVMAVAVCVFLVPPLLLTGAWGVWFYNALVLLVIACPCALVISTPVSIVAGMASAARNGVLLKGGLSLELPARLKAVALDKTGTLTTGRPAVTRVVAAGNSTEVDVLRLAGALEARSSHPLAVAVMTRLKEQNLEPPTATDLEAVPGRGLTGKVNSEAAWLGSPRFMDERGFGSAEAGRVVTELQAGGNTVIAVGTAERVVGWVALADAVRPDARRAVEALRAAGVNHVVMLTGDNQATAAAVAGQTGVDEIRAEMLPGDKVAEVERLVAKRGSVAMVGDGVNDAPAMARATLGVAMGAVGSDAAIETADVALMSDDLSKLPWLIGHSRRTLAVIRQNITFALVVKAVFLLLTVLGHASMWAAIAADTGASLLVVTNGLRLLRARAA